MKLVTAKITNLQFTLSPFSAQQMSDLGDFMIATKFARLDQALDSTDSPAPPLTDRYAKAKIKYYNAAPVRDWRFRGMTRRSIKTIRANQERVVIGPVNSQADLIMTVNRRRSEQWSDSPKDTQALHAYTEAMMQAHRVVRVVQQLKTA